MSGATRVVALIGMPGGGKTTVGRLLAKRLGWAFADVDQSIEDRSGCTVTEFFEQRGESAFRDFEADLLAELIGQGPSVVATGGGSILRADSRELLKSATVPVYLYAPLDQLWRRVGRNSRRPLLQVGDPFGRLQQLLVERHPLYCEVAQFTVETGPPSTASVVDSIVAQLQSIGMVPTAEGRSSTSVPPEQATR